MQSKESEEEFESKNYTRSAGAEVFDSFEMGSEDLQGTDGGISYSDLSSFIGACKHDEMIAKQAKLNESSANAAKKRRKARAKAAKERSSKSSDSSFPSAANTVAVAVSGRIRASDFDELTTLEKLNLAVAHVDTFKKDADYSKERQERIREGLIKIFEIQAQKESLKDRESSSLPLISPSPRPRSSSSKADNNNYYNNSNKNSRVSSKKSSLLDKLRDFLS